MRAWVKRRWLMELRSGERKQGKRYLATDRPEGWEFCCLGLLCELSPIIPAFHWDRDTRVGNKVWGHNRTVLPDSVQHWAGLGSDDPMVHYRGERTSLASMNDDGCTFPVIADTIDKEIPADVEHHWSPVPCGYCGHDDGCRTKSGRKAERHSAALPNDRDWSIAHMWLDSGHIDAAVQQLITIHERNAS